MSTGKNVVLPVTSSEMYLKLNQKYYQMYVKIYLTELMFISRYTKHSELV